MKKTLLLIVVIALVFSTFGASLSADSTIGTNQVTNVHQSFIKAYVNNQYGSNNIIINRIRKLHDFADNEYLLVECEPTGYLIYHKASGKIVEETSLSLSPYHDYYGELYYGGPTEYYIKNGNNYEHTILNETIDGKNEEYLENQSNTMSSKLIGAANEDVLRYLKTTVSDPLELEMMADAVTTISYTYKWIPYSSYLSNLTSEYRIGYYTPGGNGVCGYIAANLVLYYWQRRNPSQSIIPSSWWSNYGLNGYSLTEELVDIGLDKNYGYGTWGYEIRNVLIQYCNNQGVSASSSYYFGGGYVWGQIDAGRPVIEFGSLYLPGGGTGNHAVTVYGYRYSSSYQAIAHFGWAGYSTVIIDPVAIGSVTTFRLT